MSRQQFFKVLKNEVARIDAASVTKRQENLIDDFTKERSPKAIIRGKEYRIFNSNDYLGLRHHPKLKAAEHRMSEACGTGPGAVRFISGSFKVHRDLEKALAKFHGQDDAMVFSSAFATNMAVLFSLIKGQSKDSLVGDQVLVLSDELNHRSIIDGIRIANLPSEQKAIFKHLDMVSLEEVLKANLKKYQRVLVVTDGVFSMLGEYQDLKKMRQIIDRYDKQYPEGVLLVVDDAHGVAAFGKTGRGTEEVSGARADVLISTLGKGLGADGGYVVANQAIINYLRESAATYIYSNSISPGTAAAALASVKLLNSATGQKLVKKLAENVVFVKTELKKLGFVLAAESIHPIQAVLIGDTAKTKALKNAMFKRGFMLTNINYPVVPKGRDEIRVQISATHSKADLQAFLKNMAIVGKKLAIIK